MWASRQIEATSSRPGLLTYSAHGLPKGLAINATTGLISGTPRKAGDFMAAVTIKNSPKVKRTVRFVWTVLASGGDFFVNPARFDIPNWKTIESPIIVSGRKGNAPATSRSRSTFTTRGTGGQVIGLISENGTVIPIKDWYWDTGEGELHTTYTVDASAIPANGTWKLRVQDDTPGIFSVDAGYLDSWSLTF
ncbi:putative Ig domain-containing protein [Streptomyces sp. NPDC005146]